MHELTATEIDDVAGGFSIYYSPAPSNPINFGEIQLYAPATYQDTAPWDWNT